MREDCKNETCHFCGSTKAPLFNVTLYCPNDCDRKYDPSVKWYSYYCVMPDSRVVSDEIYLTMNIELAKKKATDAKGMLWEVCLMEGAAIHKIGGEIFQGGPVRLVQQVEID